MLLFASHCGKLNQAPKHVIYMWWYGYLVRLSHVVRLSQLIRDKTGIPVAALWYPSPIAGQIAHRWGPPHLGAAAAVGVSFAKAIAKPSPVQLRTMGDQQRWSLKWHTHTKRNQVWTDSLTTGWSNILSWASNMEIGWFIEISPSWARGSEECTMWTEQPPMSFWAREMEAVHCNH